MLIVLLACLTSLLQGAPDSLDGVQGCHCRMGCLSKKAALYFCHEGRSVPFRTEGAFHISIDCYDTTWSGHLELEISVVWYRIESSECGSSEQCVVTTTERDDIED